MLSNGKLVEASLATLFRIGLGSLFGIIPGVLLGILMGWSRRIRELVDPLIAAVHPIPKIAIFPLILIIFGIGEISNVVVIAISAFFPALVSSMTGVRHLDPIYFDVAHNYGANRSKIFSTNPGPGKSANDFKRRAVGINTGLVVAIAVELLSANSGLGVMIWFSWQTLRLKNYMLH